MNISFLNKDLSLVFIIVEFCVYTHNSAYKSELEVPYHVHIDEAQRFMELLKIVLTSIISVETCNTVCINIWCSDPTSIKRCKTNIKLVLAMELETNKLRWWHIQPGAEAGGWVHSLLDKHRAWWQWASHSILTRVCGDGGC